MSKHVKAVKHAWAEEDKRRKDRKDKEWVETEFLPAALEIMETPPRPLGRIILWVIILATVFAVVWASLSRVDIVAVAEGRVIPRGKLQSVETAESGIVRAILVSEGDRVTKGQSLIELDPTFADADADAARTELATARLQRARALALLQYSEGKPWKVNPEGLAEGVEAAETLLVAARIREFEAKIASFDARLSGASSALQQADTELARIDATLPLVKSQLEARRELADSGYAPKIQVDQLQERYTTMSFERSLKEEDVLKASQETTMIRREKSAAYESFRASAAAELSEAESVIATRNELLEKAERREALQTLKAPVDGVINEVAITTIGQTAEPGRPLVTLVPSGDELIVEVFILNKDMGFIKAGQEVIVKLEAYPFMRYGYLTGGIEHVSPDAVIDEARGLVFPARIQLTGSEMRMERLGFPVDAALSQEQSISDVQSAGRRILTPGMSAAVEIKTGKRTVLSFLLSPITRALNEAGRER